jgi:transketolase N-terminal domain/subunit
MDAVERANSGHPGTPMALAPVAYLLWTRYLKHSPRQPNWPDRDRFVLSCGHASMLIYGLLHMTGYDLPLEEIRQFRQWGSRTPERPERGPAIARRRAPWARVGCVGSARAVPGLMIQPSGRGDRDHRPGLVRTAT